MLRVPRLLVATGLSLVVVGALRAQGSDGESFTVTTTTDGGYALDSAWYSVPGRFGQMYHEGLTQDFEVTIDQDKRIGASFIEADRVHHIEVTHDVVFAQPGPKPLMYDVHSPTGAENLLEYIQVGSTGHAFFDWKPDERTKATFDQCGIYYAASMKDFFLSVLD